MAVWSACKPKFDCGISLLQDGSSGNAVRKRKRQHFFDEIESGILSEEDDNILVRASSIFVSFPSLLPLK